MLSHAYVGNGGPCMHTVTMAVAHGVTLREPCLRPREEHQR